MILYNSLDRGLSGLGLGLCPGGRAQLARATLWPDPLGGDRGLSGLGLGLGLCPGGRAQLARQRMGSTPVEAILSSSFSVCQAS
jgi:hypothetical protein